MARAAMCRPTTRVFTAPYHRAVQRGSRSSGFRHSPAGARPGFRGTTRSARRVNSIERDMREPPRGLAPVAACRKTLRTAHRGPGGYLPCRNRPTTPVGENLFEEYSETRKINFLDRLSALSKACQKAAEEPNFKKASEYMREQFGGRFPWGEDKDERRKSEELSGMIAGSGIVHKPYHG